MRLLVLYRPNSEHGRITEEYVHEYKYRNASIKVELLNVDSREGIATATLYDIVQYPAILVLKSDGAVQKIWEGDELPIMDEVTSYVNS